LRGGEICAEPDLVSRLQVGDLGDRQNLARTRDVDVYLWPSQVEARGVSVEQRTGQKSGSEGSKEARTTKRFCHHSILDGNELGADVMGPH
jgi:hypothetical protein